MALPNEITLSVDTDNDGGTTPKVDSVYSHYDSYGNRSEYIHEDHTVALRDKLGFYRTPPKAAGNFRGTAKTAVKFTRDFSVEGVDATTRNIAPGIIDIGFSFPVGMTSAECLELRMRAVALLLDDTIMVPLTIQQMV